MAVSHPSRSVLIDLGNREIREARRHIIRAWRIIEEAKLQLALSGSMKSPVHRLHARRR